MGSYVCTRALCEGLRLRTLIVPFAKHVTSRPFTSITKQACVWPQQLQRHTSHAAIKGGHVRVSTRFVGGSSGEGEEDEETKKRIDAAILPVEGSYRKSTRIDEKRAADEYCLDAADLVNLPFQVKHRSPWSGAKRQLITYLKSDVERKAKEKWGSLENMEREKARRAQINPNDETMWQRIKKAYYLFMGSRRPDAKRLLLNQQQEREDDRLVHLRHSMRVVVYAIASNTVVMAGKFGAFFYTGSASMLSEGIHSLADVANQTLLAVGIMRSLRQPDGAHPYGYLNERYLWALISGVGIFFVGCGVSCYHGVMCLLHPAPVENISVAFTLLAMSGLLEGASLAVAAQQVRENAKRAGVGVLKYIRTGSDPNDVAVLVEDSAAVLGVGIAGGCLALTHIYETPVFDAIGSISIGSLLGACAMFLIHRNMDALVGRSIPSARIRMIMARMDQDPVITSTHDVKATQMGTDTVRFKAEIDVDGGAIAQKYVAGVTAGAILEEMKRVQTEGQVEAFMARHGAGIVNILGEEVDRIEGDIKRIAPEVRHVDLEIL
eukprot:comp15119_c0_seq1/m.11793 comp15119_c0_seq1/g.11793  ORF comp15119_c0_seq1/g.11793 comp15119_c0_seq1/m.11793 type:complete len:550 (-) comp15119_c0_seq1:56-1705(-)